MKPKKRKRNKSYTSIKINFSIIISFYYNINGNVSIQKGQAETSSTLNILDPLWHWNIPVYVYVTHLVRYMHTCTKYLKQLGMHERCVHDIFSLKIYAQCLHKEIYKKKKQQNQRNSQPATSFSILSPLEYYFFSSVHVLIDAMQRNGIRIFSIWSKTVQNNARWLYDHFQTNDFHVLNTTQRLQPFNIPMFLRSNILTFCDQHFTWLTMRLQTWPGSRRHVHRIYQISIHGFKP